MSLRSERARVLAYLGVVSAAILGFRWALVDRGEREPLALAWEQVMAAQRTHQQRTGAFAATPEALGVLRFPPGVALSELAGSETTWVAVLESAAPHAPRRCVITGRAAAKADSIRVTFDCRATTGSRGKSPPGAPTI